MIRPPPTGARVGEGGDDGDPVEIGEHGGNGRRAGQNEGGQFGYQPGIQAGLPDFSDYDLFFLTRTRPR